MARHRARGRSGRGEEQQRNGRRHVANCDFIRSDTLWALGRRVSAVRRTSAQRRHVRAPGGHRATAPGARRGDGWGPLPSSGDPCGATAPLREVRKTLRSYHASACTHRVATERPQRCIAACAAARQQRSSRAVRSAISRSYEGARRRVFPAAGPLAHSPDVVSALLRARAR